MAWISLRSVEEQKKNRKKFFWHFWIAALLFLVVVLLSVLNVYEKEYMFEHNKHNCVYRIYSASDVYDGSFTIARRDNKELGTLYGIKVRDAKGVVIPFCFDADKVSLNEVEVITSDDAYITFFTDGTLVSDDVILHVPSGYAIVDDDEFFKEAHMFSKKTSGLVKRTMNFKISNSNSEKWWKFFTKSK